MNKFKKAGRQALSVFLSATTVLWLSGAAMLVPSAASAASLTQSQVNSIIGLLQSFGADSSTIANVQASLTGGTPTGGSTGTATSCVFNRSLTLGSTGEDVKCLQKYLNGHGYPIASTGPGSPGSESTYFGAKTKAAVAAWQAAAGVTPAAGYFGPVSQAKLASMGGGTTPPVTPGTTPPTSVGTGLTVSSTVQPQASLAPYGAARVPFTKATFTASSDGDVTVNSLTVERTGLAVDSNFAGVVLLDEAGNQLGLSKTFNSNHQAVLSEPFVVKAGQSRTMTIAGNMAGSAAIQAGQVAFLSLVSVGTSATVNGVLPIVGAGHTMNASLTIGTATLLLGSLDPNNASASKEVGTTGYTFSSIRVTAGSAEKVKLNSIRWNQAGSIGSGDLANLKTYVEGVAYPMTVSSDGKYFTANLGGKVLDKGESAEISIKGDIVSGSARTIEFDLYKNTDLNITGETYGYGITATGSGTGFTATSPFFSKSIVTVSNGSIAISKGTSVAAQNIAVNLSNEPLGGFQVEVKGEPISVSSSVFNVSGVNPTSVSLVGPTGNVVAGPVDASNHVVTFTDTITYPIGIGTYTLKGKIPTGTAANTSVTASTTASGWTTVTGQQTGNSITPSGGTVTANTMTVKTAIVAISVSGTPVSQTIVPGGTVNFANYLFDATGSGEDVRFSTIPLAYTVHVGAGASATSLTNCKLKDSNGTDLTTGSNTVNPSAAASSTTFTFDNQFTAVKGTVTSVGLFCNVAGGATGAYNWGVYSSATFTGTGKTSGQSATVTATQNLGPLMTLASGGAGTLTVAEDTSASLTARLAYGGQSNIKLAQLKFHAANEAINLTNLALQLTNFTSSSTSATASSSASDFVGNTLKLWKSDGVTQVGSIAISSGYKSGTTTNITGFQIPKDGDAVMIVTADLSPIGVSESGTEGHVIAVDYDGTNSTNTKGVGVSSGSTISSSSSSDTAVASVRVYKSVPSVAESTTIPTGNSLVAGGEFYKFTVSAAPSSATGIYLYKVSFQVTTTSVTSVGNWKLYGPNGAVNSSYIETNHGILNMVFDATAADRFIGAGSSKTFSLKADSITHNTGTESMTVKMLGDAAAPDRTSGVGNHNFGGAVATSTFMSTAANIDAGTNDDFIWSPQATTTVTADNNDFTNGYAVPFGTGTETLTNDLPARSFTFTN